MKTVSAFLFVLVLFIFTAHETKAQICGVFEKRVNNTCVKFKVPSNAHLTYSGNSWDCNRGFKRIGQLCEEIKVPVNASANLIGSYYCNSGYERDGNECIKIPGIENGKFYEYGADFYCTGGYLKNADAKKCEKIIVPKNAREDLSSLDGWSCFSGYIKEGSECKKFDLPEHGFWLHNYWGCESGYKKNADGKTCGKISIPKNAHISDTFDGWLCNSGYTKNYCENRCEKK